MVIFRHIHWAMALLGLSMSVPANEAAVELLESYEKKDVVEMLLKKCYGEVTINDPFPKRVYGRPPAGQIDERTLAHDMKRCKFNVDDAHAYFEKRGALRRRSDPARIVGGSSASSSRTTSRRSSSRTTSRRSTSSSYGASGNASLQERLRNLERKQRDRDRAEARRRREGERELEQARRAEQSDEERDKEQRERQCRNARDMRDSYRKHATGASSVKSREEYRRLADELQGAIRANCKSVL